MTEETIQVKLNMDLIKKIRDTNSDYKRVPAACIAEIALNHFLYELTHKKGA